MKPNYKIHEDVYAKARLAGWEGWGGNKRMSRAFLVERFLKLKGVPKDGKLLELGCGEGHHCRALANLGFEVSGIDISPTAIKWASEKAETTGIIGQFRVADLTDESLRFTNEYSVVIDGNCLHCIIGSDRVRVLCHVYNALAKNGVFFVSSLCSKADNSFETTKDGRPYRHIATQKSLAVELKMTGFKVIKSKIYERENIDHITIHAVK